MIRGPKKIQVDYARGDIYKSYKKTAKEPVAQNIHSKILNDFNKEVSRLILEETFINKIAIPEDYISFFIWRRCHTNTQNWYL